MRALAGSLGVAILLAGCGDTVFEPPPAVPAASAASGSHDRSAIPVPALAPRVLVIHVDDDAAPGGNGSGRFPFDNLPDAVDAARKHAGSVIVEVEPGDYPLASTLVIDRPLDLRGSTKQSDGADSWPTGEVVLGTLTRVFAANPMLTQLVVVDRGDAAVLHDVNIRGFAFEATTSGVSLVLNRVQDYRIADNVFRAPANFALKSVASSGHVSGNHFSGVGTGAIFNGGYPGSPSNVTFQGNRAVRNTLGGVLVNGASIDIPELGDEVNAIVRDNDLSENVGTQGFGFRAFILRRDPGAPGDSQSSASVNALVEGNRIVGNRIGISLDAGFPFRSVGPVCDMRVFSGTIDVRFAGNTLPGSSLVAGLITFTRNQAAFLPSCPSGNTSTGRHSRSRTRMQAWRMHGSTIR